ncbi:hypothetical protein ACIA74_43490 [Streptomyces sp. NPDC051658]|uniref:hypothetical protein n=1 Tax=Streptomyces sp. NPDC051658 TaxID=3365667 RepID=UPI0037BA0853
MLSVQTGRPHPVRADARDEFFLEELRKEFSDECSLLMEGPVSRGWYYPHSDVNYYVVDPTATSGLDTSWPSLPSDGRFYYREGKRFQVFRVAESAIEEFLSVVTSIDDGTKRSRAAIPSEILAEAARLSDAVLVDPGTSDLEWQTKLTKQLSCILSGISEERGKSAIAETLSFLGSGDEETAVLTAVEALENSIDILFLRHGQMSPDTKWRYKKIQEIESSLPAMQFATTASECRRLLARADLDVESGGEWCHQVIDFCQQILAAR